MRMARGDGREAVVRGTAEQVEHALSQRLALEVPERDVDRRDGVGGDAAMVAVPPRLLLVLAPQRLGLYRVLADQIGRHAFDDRLGGEIGFRELGDRFAPADLAVVSGDLDQAEMPQCIEVVRLRVADGNGFDLGDLHGQSYPMAPRNSGIPSTPTSTSISRPVSAAPVVSNGPMSQQNSLPPLPKQQLSMVPPV